jgi:hypothetical protein
VAFFGDLLPDIDGKEFIYREHPTVRLADIAERLKVRRIDISCFGLTRICFSLL